MFSTSSQGVTDALEGGLCMPEAGDPFSAVWGGLSHLGCQCPGSECPPVLPCVFHSLNCVVEKKEAALPLCFQDI